MDPNAVYDLGPAGREIQQALLTAGYYRGEVDGLWGALSRTALADALAAATARQQLTVPPVTPPNYLQTAWGAKVTQVFLQRAAWIADTLGVPLNYLMSVMAFETGKTFSARVKNFAGSGATGLIQFMPETARALGTTVERLGAMTAEDQLNYVYRYLAPYKGRLHSLSDIYMAVLWPAAIGQAESYELWSQTGRPTVYRQNSGLDANTDGLITKGEAAAKIQAALDEGLRPENMFGGE